jgi:cytochrome c-type biogenesis protein
MGVVEASWGGFSSFFSIWQVCILQISPFYMIFATGLYLSALDSEERPGLLVWTVIPSLAYVIGFSIFFALLSSSGLYAGRYLTYHIESLRFASGMFFLFAALFILLSHRIAVVSKLVRPVVAVIISFFVGVTFALIYSPCITPTLSKILGLAVRPESAQHGSIMALFYGLGMSLAFAIVAALLITILQRKEKIIAHGAIIRDVCAGILLVLAIMNITGVMVYYKAFFLGLLVK